MPRKIADDLDRIIARNIRHCRLGRGVTRQAFAAAIGVSCQQVQKYETGANRITASRLVRIGLILRVPLADLVAATQVQISYEEEASPTG